MSNYLKLKNNFKTLVEIMYFEEPNLITLFFNKVIRLVFY
jgi:hypothetical protein